MNMENKKLIYILIGLPVVILTLFVGIYIGEEHTGNPLNTNSELSEISNSKEFESFWKVWKILDEKLVTAASTTNQSKIYGAIQGLTASYGDPYTVFFPPAESKMFKDDIAGDFGGVGMEIGSKDKQIIVVSPLKNSPAERAGVRAGDFVLSINGTSTAGMTTDEAVKLIRGPKGTVVNISFLPVGAVEPVLRSITRDTIKIPTIDITTKPGGITVISLYSFTAQSPDLFRCSVQGGGRRSPRP